MVAETKASNGPAFEEIYGPFSSNEDLCKPGVDGITKNDQVNNPSCSDLPETEDEDIAGNAFNNKEAIQNGSTIFPEGNTAVVGHGTGSGTPNENLVDESGKFDKLLYKDEVSSLKGTDEEPFMLKDATLAQGNSLEGGDWVQDFDASILEDNDGDTQYCFEVANSEPATSKLESGAPKSSSVSCGETTSDPTVTCETVVLAFSNVSNEGTGKFFLEPTKVNLDSLLKSASGSDENGLEYDGGNTHCNTMLVDSTDGSTANKVYLDEASSEAVVKPFNFFARIPRFNDESLREEISIAKLNIEKKTKVREAIQVQIQEKRAENQIPGCDYKNSKIDHRKAWDLVTLKRMEIDSVQSMLNKAKNAVSIQDIDRQICNMEHMIQHETRTLKEEKQLLRRIKQLKQLRGELSSNLGSQDEIKQALEQREELEERLMVFRKELDVLKDNVQKAEAAVVKAAKKYEDGYKKVKELQTQFREANEVRQVAYADLQSLRKELREKNKHFFKYKEDAAAASIYASKRDQEALHHLCMNQVENFMKLWNENEEFRKEYVKFNTRSTLKRFGTLDGRSLSPNEEPLILPSYTGGTVQMMKHKAAQVDKLKQETTDETLTNSDVKIQPVGNIIVNENHDKSTDKVPAETVVVNGFTDVSEDSSPRDVLEKSSEEIELARKAEEMRREEEAKLKEQRRLEELVKANDARERKKHQAEKEQLRAQLKALKEAELREKEREKKLRKKEKQKAADANDTHKKNGEDGANAAIVVEMGHSKEVKNNATTSDMTNKKPNHKSCSFAKQSKNKSLPPPLRNRNKKYYRQWLWVGVSCIAIFVLFWLGNLGTFSKANLKKASSSSSVSFH